METQAQFHAKIGTKKPLAQVESLGARKITTQAQSKKKKKIDLPWLKMVLCSPPYLHRLCTWATIEPYVWSLRAWHPGTRPHTHTSTIFPSEWIYSWNVFKYVNPKMLLLPNQCNHIWNSASACLRQFLCFWWYLVTWVLWAAQHLVYQERSAKHPFRGTWFNLRGCCCWE